MDLIFITENPCHAKDLSVAGVNYIMVDLEINGKQERQGHLNTIISRHNIESIGLVSDSIKGSSAKVLVRVNPLYENSKQEIDKAIALGASKLMLPMFRTSDEVETFQSMVDDRVPVTLLVETASALARLPDILRLPGDYDIHVGLNDLHLEMKLNFMFELLLKDGIVEHISQLCNRAGRKFGFGGVSRLQGVSPLAAEQILSEHIRLGSSSVILSRDWRKSLDEGDFAQQVNLLRDFLSEKKYLDPLVISRKISSISKDLILSK
jgi:2-keto-3-deoxy-L-rhamnonate aldolase RhmA